MQVLLPAVACLAAAPEECLTNVEKEQQNGGRCCVHYEADQILWLLVVLDLLWHAWGFVQWSRL